MHLLWHLFRKDLGYLRWWWIASLLPLGLTTWFECGYGFPAPGNVNYQLNEFTQMLVSVGWWFLLAAAVHAEAIPGDCQYWLTRPVPRAALLGSKLVVAGLMILLPLLLADGLILYRNGFNPLEQVGGLLVKQMRTLLVLLLPAMAIAAITTGTAQFIIGGFVALAVNVILFAMFTTWRMRSAQIATWAPDLLVTVLMVGAAIGVLLLQYRSRRTRLSRAIAAAVVLVVPMQTLFPAGMAFALEEAVSKPAAASAIRLVADLDRPRTPRPGGYGWAPDGTVVVVVPVRVEGASPAAELVWDWEEYSFTADSGRRHEVKRMLGVGMFPETEGAGRSLRLPVERGFFDQEGQNPVRLRIRGAVRVMGNPRRSRVPAVFGYRRIEGIGYCHSDDRAQPYSLQVYCNAPLAMPVWAMQRLMLREGGPATLWPNLVRAHSRMANISPIARAQSGFLLNPGNGGPANREGIKRDQLAQAEIEFTVWEPQSFARVDFEFPNLRLAEVVTRNP